MLPRSDAVRISFTAMPADAPLSPSDFAATLQAGTKLAGCYLLRTRIDGAEWPLWKARDEVLDKDITLQLLPGAFSANGEAMEHLRQEVKRARQFVHPRAVRVHDLIEEDGWTGLAMDAFEGHPLAAAVAGNSRGFFDVSEVWPLAREVCEILGAAHDLRIVHGGVSPENILVGDGHGKLMNFGVAAAVRRALGIKSPFSSPQSAGARAEIADDVFSVGALLHALLAGAPPAQGGGSRVSIAEHRRALNHAGAEVPANWERVVASCLSPQPGDRPASCQEILHQLEPAAAAGNMESVVAMPAPARVITPPAPEPVVSAAPIVQPATEAASAPESKPAEQSVVEKTQPPAEKSAPLPGEPKDEPAREIAAGAAAESAAPAPERAPGKAAASGPHVDEHELAEKVRREEAEEEARGLARDVDEDFDEPPHGGGLSMVTLAIIAGFVALAGFIVYRAFFSESPARPKREVVDVLLATPTPLPTVAPAPQQTPEPTPRKATPAPSPTPAPATPTPAPATPMVQIDGAKMPPKGDEPQKAAAALAELKQERDKIGRELPSARKALDELAAQQKKLDDDLKKADAAATEAEKLAAERKKTAEDTRKAAIAAAEQVAARKSDVAKAEEQLARLEKELKDKERAMEEARLAAEAAKRLERDAARAAEKMATPLPAPNATPAPLVSGSTPPAAEDPRAAFERKMKELSRVLDAPPGQAAKPATPSPAPGMAPVEMAKATTPAPEKIAKPGADGLSNSLGMRLIPLPGSDVLACIWPTRVRDFEQFAKTTGLKSVLWKDPGFKQGPDHPVVNVTWQEAMAFCKWLTVKEQKEGVIGSGQSYRLLTDLEWSRAAGLSKESGSTPEARDMGVPDVYPWGNTWPPPVGAGNYTGEETGSDVAIKGYNDGFPWTSPVGSFPANKLGFFDMGGNVWQWCMDSWNAESKAKVLRGASWYNGALKLSLLTSCRVHASPDSSTDNYGFRVALSGQDGKTSK